ncbi:MAG: hypothetical protein ACTSRA_07115, partial [Promethearchaeota archaeon]
FNNFLFRVVDDVVTFQKHFLPILHHEDDMVIERIDLVGFFLVLYAESLKKMVTEYFMQLHLFKLRRCSKFLKLIITKAAIHPRPKGYGFLVENGKDKHYCLMTLYKAM